MLSITACEPVGRKDQPYIARLGEVHLATAERSFGTIGLITLDEKCAGARSAGNPHAACEVAGAGNELTDRLVRHSQRKRGETDRPVLRSIAPVLDPTRDRSSQRCKILLSYEEYYA